MLSNPFERPCFRLRLQPRSWWGAMRRVGLCVLPFDRTANGCLLISRRHTGVRNRAHGLDKLSGRPRGEIMSLREMLHILAADEDDDRALFARG
jgi:hypothetical protein